MKITKIKNKKIDKFIVSLVLSHREFVTIRDALRTQLAVNNTLYKDFHWNEKEEEIERLKRMIKEMEAE